jgi:peptide/nickel transport system ATP-binding protein
MTGPLLAARLTVHYPGGAAVLRNAAFEIGEGEAFGLAGPSGSGKSTIALAVLGLARFRGAHVEGEILFEGRDLLRLGERQLRRVRGREIALVMQSPLSALNPMLSVESHMRETWQVHGRTPWRAAQDDARALLRRMGLPNEDGFLRRRPSEISVGQAQRVLIAMALLHRPKLIVADEPTSALDPASRLEVMGLLRSLNREYGAAILYISHDLDSMEQLCGRTAVLEGGRVMARDAALVGAPAPALGRS